MSRKILDEHGGAKRRKVFALDEYEGHRYMEIREYYLSGDDWKPGRKGITLNRDTYRILRDLIEREDESIMDWVGMGYVPEDVARYEEVQEQAAIDNRYRSGDLVVESYNEPRDSCFFAVRHEGNLDHVELNEAHPLAQLLAQDNGEEILKIIGLLLQSYYRARTMLSDSPAIDPNTIFMHLEQDWGKYLRDALKG